MSEEILDMPQSSGNKKNIDEVIENGFEFRFSDYINEGFELAKKNLGIMVAYTVVYAAILGAASFIPFASLLVTGPLLVGFFIGANKLKYEGKVEFGDFFKGFNHFVPLLLATLVTGLFIVLGMVLLIIPGIYLAVAYGFVNLIIVFHGHEFWDSMEYSRKLITKKWWSFFGFTLVLGLINMLGLLALGIGVLVTLPITMCATYCAFDDILGTDKYEG